MAEKQGKMPGDASITKNLCSQITWPTGIKMFFVVFVLPWYTTGQKLSQLIWPPARGRHNGGIIRLGFWCMPYLFRDIQGLFLAPALNTEYKTPSCIICRTQFTGCWVCQLWKFLGSQPGVWTQDLQCNRPAFYQQTTQLWPLHDPVEKSMAGF